MVNSTGRFIFSLALHFVLVFFSPFSIAITWLGEERAGLCAFRAFVCFASVGLCFFSLPLDVRDRMRHVIVSLPGLFFLPFFKKAVFCDCGISRVSSYIFSNANTNSQTLISLYTYNSLQFVLTIPLWFTEIVPKMTKLKNLLTFVSFDW